MTILKKKLDLRVRFLHYSKNFDISQILYLYERSRIEHNAFFVLLQT